MALETKTQDFAASVDCLRRTLHKNGDCTWASLLTDVPASPGGARIVLDLVAVMPHRVQETDAARITCLLAYNLINASREKIARVAA